MTCWLPIVFHNEQLQMTKYSAFNMVEKKHRYTCTDTCRMCGAVRPENWWSVCRAWRSHQRKRADSTPEMHQGSLSEQTHRYFILCILFTYPSNSRSTSNSNKKNKQKKKTSLIPKMSHHNIQIRTIVFKSWMLLLAISCCFSSGICWSWRRSLRNASANEDLSSVISSSCACRRTSISESLSGNSALLPADTSSVHIHIHRHLVTLNHCHERYIVFTVIVIL